jgi:shikimate dehydrogenase
VPIDGHTRPAGVIGWPVSHSLSPAMHNAAYEAMDLNWVYLPLPVSDAGALFSAVGGLRELPFVGFNITMPYKQLMLDLCDEVAMLAQLAGAVNTVHVVDGRLIGYNTDGRGLVESLSSDAGFDPAGRSVVVIGAGGAAGAAVTGFIIAKAASLTVVNRDVSNAEALISRVSDRLHGMVAAALPLGPEAESAVREADLVVNATPVGMGPSPTSPIPDGWIRKDQLVYDMTYHPTETPLLKSAAAAGATAVGGLGMLVAQGALAIDIWLGADAGQLRAPRDVMRSAAQEALAEMQLHGGEE